MAECKQSHLTIVGAGITGLVLAYKLCKAKKDKVIIVDSKAHAGGTIQSEQYQHISYELGPNTIMNSCTALQQLIEELDLKDSLIESPMKNSKRFFYRQGQMLEVPLNPIALWLSPHFSIDGRFRVLLEPFIQSSNKEESIVSFLTRRCGKDVAENMAATFLQGVWGGDAAKLSAKTAFKRVKDLEEKYGSLTIGALLEISKAKSAKQKSPLAMQSFKYGMQELGDALKNKITELGGEVLLENQIKSIQHDGDKFTLVSSKAVITSKQVCLSTAAPAAAQLCKTINPELSQALFKIPYNSMQSLTYTLPKELFKQELNGFGYIYDYKSEAKSLGTIWASQIFKERELKDEYLFTTYMGGTKNPGFINYHPELKKQICIQEQAESMSSLTTRKLESSDFKFINSWQAKQAIPQYTLQYQDLLDEIKQTRAQTPQLMLAGNYLTGISVPQCIEAAIDLSAKI